MKIKWISLINKGYVKFAQAFFRQAPSTFTKGLVVYCVDIESCEAMTTLGVECRLFLDNHVSKNLETYGSDTYRRIAFSKLDAINLALHEFSAPVGFVDFDIAMFKDPNLFLEEFLNENQNIQILSQDNLEEGEEFCTGFIVFNSSFSFDYANDFNSFEHDQDWLNHYTKKHGIHVTRLPKKLFPTGQTANVRNISMQNQNLVKSQAYLLHFNYLLSHEKAPYMNAWGWIV